MICGKSTHNQLIERLWRDVYSGVTGLYHELFNFIEDEEILDPYNKFDLAALHYVSLLLINDELGAWRQAWSKHRMRTVKTSPIRLWVSGQINSTLDDDLNPEQLLHYSVEGVVDGNDDEMADNDCPIFLSSTAEVLQRASFLHYKEKCLSSRIWKITGQKASSKLKLALRSIMLSNNECN